MRKAFYFSGNLTCIWLDGLNPEVQTETTRYFNGILCFSVL